MEPSAPCYRSRVEAAGIEDAARIERRLHPPRDARQRRRFGRHHLHRGAQRFRRAQQRPGAAARRGRPLRPPRASAASAGPASHTRPPPQSRKPLHARPRRRRAARRGRRRGAPRRARPRRRLRRQRDARRAPRATPRATRRRPGSRPPDDASSSRSSRCGRRPRGEILDAQQRDGAAELARVPAPAPPRRRQPGGGGDAVRRAEAGRQRGHARRRHPGRAAPACRSPPAPAAPSG